MSDTIRDRLAELDLTLPAAAKSVADLPTFTFGRSKGLGFDRIYPTEKMMSCLENPKDQLEGEARAKLYVALTRGRHVVAIVHDLPDGKSVPGFSIFE